MLEPWIIEQIRRREEEEQRRRYERPQLEIPRYEDPDPDRFEPPLHSPEDEKDSDRGVVIIDFAV